MSGLSIPGHPFQYAWHVPDLESAVDYWANVLGVGPFFVNEVDSSSMAGFTYRGQPGLLRMKVAWAQSKEGQIELIEVLSSESNVYHDLIKKDRRLFTISVSGQTIIKMTRPGYLLSMRMSWIWAKAITSATSTLLSTVERCWN